MNVMRDKFLPVLMSVLPFVTGSLLFPQSAFFAQQVFAQQVFARQQIVTASQVNGTWKSQFGTFKILALGNQKLKVEFSGTYVYKLADGSPMANSGQGSGTAMIEGRVATFKPDGVGDKCLIAMEFVDDGLIVEQEGNCGFGLNVTAAGKYRKVSAHQPKFGEN